MPIEITLLAWAAALGLAHLLATVPFVIGHHGLSYVFGPRDPQAPLTGRTARFERAFHNFLQTFPFFAVAILVVTLTGRHSWQTVFGAELYLGARFIYIPVYVGGVPVLRTLVWLASVAAIGLILAAAL
jgi:uncharacterized MAPEG superfamily protein